MFRVHTSHQREQHWGDQKKSATLVMCGVTSVCKDREELCCTAACWNDETGLLLICLFGHNQECQSVFFGCSLFTSACCFARTFGIWIWLNHSVSYSCSPCQDMKGTSFVICIFTPECMFQVGIEILWAALSPSAAVSWSASVSFSSSPCPNGFSLDRPCSSLFFIFTPYFPFMLFFCISCRILSTVDFSSQDLF